MANDVSRFARQKVDNYRRALRYLDGCGDITLDKMREAIRLSGVDMSERDLHLMWDGADKVLPTAGMPGGQEAARHILRQTLIRGMAVFEGAAAGLDALDIPGTESRGKWWQFWR